MNVVLIMAGGRGKRMGTSEKKQFIKVNHKPLIVYTIGIFLRLPEIDKIIVVAPESDNSRMQNICLSEFPDASIKIVPGGKSRQNSVINGLQACPADTDLVLIHDAVRPFAKAEMIRQLIKLAEKHQAAIPASSVRYTLKQVKCNKILQTIPRSDLYNAQTPQVFKYHLIKKYHELALHLDKEFTDDSSILEYYRIPVHILEVDENNFKITEPIDLEIARYLLSK